MLGQQYNVAIKMAAYSRHMLKFEQMLAREEKQEVVNPPACSSTVTFFINCRGSTASS
jgi:hypothetical protein